MHVCSRDFLIADHNSMTNSVSTKKFSEELCKSADQGSPQVHCSYTGTISSSLPWVCQTHIRVIFVCLKESVYLFLGKPSTSSSFVTARDPCCCWTVAASSFFPKNKGILYFVELVREPKITGMINKCLLTQIFWGYVQLLSLLFSLWLPPWI